MKDIKLLCVDNKHVGLCITVGNWYRVVNVDDTTYLVYDDKNQLVSLDKKYFKTLEELRELKLNELGI